MLSKCKNCGNLPKLKKEKSGSMYVKCSCGMRTSSYFDESGKIPTDVWNKSLFVINNYDKVKIEYHGDAINKTNESLHHIAESIGRIEYSQRQITDRDGLIDLLLDKLGLRKDG